MDVKNYEIKDFTRINFQASIPDLLDIQLSSWIDFLQEDILPEKELILGWKQFLKIFFQLRIIIKIMF